MSARLDAALEYAKQGIKIFPCWPGGKHGRFNGYFEAATTDPDVIRGWFETYGDCNIAYCPEDNGRCVVDIDNKNGQRGQAEWFDLPGEKPQTLTVSTPTGGLHLHYLGSLRQTAKELAPGIDTRGIRSLAVLPPSVTKDGQYEVLIPMDPVPAPAWLLEWGKPREHARLEAPEGMDPDALWNIDLARQVLNEYVRKGDVAKEGSGGDQRTYDLAAEVMDYVNPHVALELIAELWNPHCDPPWSDDELSDIVEHASKYRTNAIGAKALPDPAKLMEGLPPQNSTGTTTQGRRRFQGRKPSEGAKLPPLEYWDTHRDKRILPRMPAACSIIVYGPAGSHKTGVVLKELVDACLAGARVLYIAAEGGHGIETARLPELLRQRGLPIDALDDRWWTLSESPDILDEQDMAELYMEYRDFAPNLIALDTGTRCIGAADINTTAVGTQAIKALEQLGRPWNSTVLYVTHPGKDEERGAIGSRQQENQGYGVWRIEHENGLIKIHVEKMKDGLAQFYVPMRVRLGGVPVVYEMSPEERAKLLHGGPTHDELRDAIYGMVWKWIQEDHDVAPTNRSNKYGPDLIRVTLEHAGIEAEEEAIKEALLNLVAQGRLAYDEKGGRYLLGTAAQSPETLQ